MLPVTQHLPPAAFGRDELRAAYHDNMTPAEVAAWLDRRERERHLAQIDRVVNVALVLVAAALLYATIGLFTH